MGENNGGLCNLMLVKCVIFVLLSKQAIGARELARCQLTVCLEF